MEKESGIHYEICMVYMPPTEMGRVKTRELTFTTILAEMERRSILPTNDRTFGQNNS